MPEERLHSIDGLRAIAAGLVVLHHLGAAALQAQLAGGRWALFGTLCAQATASGVELFFVLSGIVLVRPYVSGQKQMRPFTYAWRRAQRLYPPYWGAWLLSGVAIFLASAYPTWWTRGASLAEFSLSGWLSQLGLIYVGYAPFNFAWWSLTVEVIFYVLIPLCLPLLINTRSDARKRATLFVVCVVVALLGYTVIEPLLAKWAEFLPVIRLDLYASCFCAGLLLAQRPLTLRIARVLVVSGICWIAVCLFVPRMNHHIGWGMLYFGIASMAMNRDSVLARRLSSDLMIWLGERSYSLFLTHFAVIGLVCHFVSWEIASKNMTYFVVSRVLSLFLSLWTAMLLFHFVERRFARNLATADMFWPPGFTAISIRTKHATLQQAQGASVASA